MKPLILLAILNGLGFAQVPAVKPPAAKPAAAKPAVPAAKPKPAVTAINPRLLSPGLWVKPAPPSFKAKFVTTKGDFVVEVTRDWAPRGADRFYNLVRSGFFTDVSFYRVLPGFVIQFGASPSPRVEAVWGQAKLADDPVKQQNKKFTLTFAMGGPNTRTTQVFINVGENQRLDAMGFSPFGEVIEGREIVEQFYSYGDMAEQGGRGPSQERVRLEGKAYLDKNFPQLDSIKSATITFEAPPPAPPAKVALPAAKKALPVQKSPTVK